MFRHVERLDEHGDRCAEWTWSEDCERLGLAGAAFKELGLVVRPGKSGENLPRAEFVRKAVACHDLSPGKSNWPRHLEALESLFTAVRDTGSAEKASRILAGGTSFLRRDAEWFTRSRLVEDCARGVIAPNSLGESAAPARRALAFLRELRRAIDIDAGVPVADAESDTPRP